MRPVSTSLSRSSGWLRAAPSKARVRRPEPSATAHVPRSGSNRADSGGRPCFSPTFAPSRARRADPRASPASGQTSRAARSSSGGAPSSRSRCWTLGASIILQDCRSPRALLPEAAAQAERGWCFLLAAGESRALVAGDEVLVDRSFAELESADLRLIATAGRPVTGLPPAPSRASLTAADLEARHAASLANGLRLAPRDWERIRKAAARILVPASARSRSRGAGAEVDDNE